MSNSIVNALNLYDNVNIVGVASSFDETYLLINKYKHIDLFTLDINIGNNNGLDLIEILRNRYPKSFILMISGEGSLVNLDKAINRGANDFLVKPFSVEELKKKLALLLK